jgi:hypothetical protein
MCRGQKGESAYSQRMRRPMVWLPLLGAVLGLAASYRWPWPATVEACPSTSAGPRSCIVPADLVAQHLLWALTGAGLGAALALLVIIFRPASDDVEAVQRR